MSPGWKGKSQLSGQEGKVGGGEWGGWLGEPVGGPQEVPEGKVGRREGMVNLPVRLKSQEVCDGEKEL